MDGTFPLTDYIEQAMCHATYTDLEDGSVAGRIPDCPGVLAFAETLNECKVELRSVLEDWMIVGFRLGHPLPVIGGLDLNVDVSRDLVLASLGSL